MYQAPKQKTFSHNKYEGASNSFMLASEWARRLEHFVNVFYEHDERGDWDFSAEEHACSEDYDFLEWASEMDVDSEVFAAVVELRHFVPLRR